MGSPKNTWRKRVTRGLKRLTWKKSWRKIERSHLLQYLASMSQKLEKEQGNYIKLSKYEE